VSYSCKLHVRYALRMTVNVQIRNVPEKLANELKARAAARRQSLSDYLLGELEQIAETPTINDWLDRHLTGPPRELGVTAVELLDEVRAEE
jgi:antitoxin FitA